MNRVDVVAVNTIFVLRLSKTGRTVGRTDSRLDGSSVGRTHLEHIWNVCGTYLGRIRNIFEIFGTYLEHLERICNVFESRGRIWNVFETYLERICKNR